MAAIKRPRETRNGRFWMLIELKKSCIGESDAGNQTPFTATKPRNARVRVCMRSEFVLPQELRTSRACPRVRHV